MSGTARMQRYAATARESWRPGRIAADDARRDGELSAPIEALLRKRSRRLLGDLLRPHRRAVALTAAAIIVASLASLAGPWLIGVAIDNGIPPLVKNGDPVPLLRIAAVFAATVLVQAAATRMFVTLTGRFGQAVVLELRRRLFAHLLRLPVSFHESYTSGRVISRQTSDVDAISDLFDEGLDGLITAVLSCLLVGTGMLLLDWPLALVVLSGFIPLTWLSAWFRRRSAVTYRWIREANALVIVHFVETFGGLRAVQAFRRERAERRDLRRAERGLRPGEQAVRADQRDLRAGDRDDRERHHRHRALLRRAAGARRRHQDRRARVVPAVPAAVLRPAAGRLAVLQHLPERRLRAREDLRRA